MQTAYSAVAYGDLLQICDPYDFMDRGDHGLDYIHPMETSVPA